jgi:hypothetical protein
MKVRTDVVELQGTDLVFKQYYNGEVERQVKIDLADSYTPIYVLEQLAKLLKRRAEEANRNLATARDLVSP